MTHKEKLLKWLDEYYDKERKANFRKNVEDSRRRAAIMTELAKEKQERYHDYIARRYRELEEK
tara:strand:- start:1414 stop:1602 length:189 start_codon:yes stop_codon:yes gene_type:complete